jgi:hypothetical protein
MMPALRGLSLGLRERRRPPVQATTPASADGPDALPGLRTDLILRDISDIEYLVSMAASEMLAMANDLEVRAIRRGPA